MKILMLSWDYPPRVVGGMARHVAELSEALGRRACEVHVLTSSRSAGGDGESMPAGSGGTHASAGVSEGSGAESPGTSPVPRGANGRGSRGGMGGVSVHRLGMYSPRPLDFVGSVMQLNIDMLEEAVRLLGSNFSFDLIHCHDWLSAYAAKALKHAKRRPLIATIHATEFGRNSGLHTPLQRYISDVEWWLTYEAWRVICCSKYMAQELRGFFQVPADKIEVIPNAVNPANFAVEERELGAFRSEYASPTERIVFFIGRLVHEKGAGVLIEAIPLVLSRYPNAKFIIAGEGPEETGLKNRAMQLGVYHKVYFTGYVSDPVRNKLYAVSDVAVFPSLYEPFGIVALEAMSAGVPVVASRTGGFAEIIDHGINGFLCEPGEPESLAENILSMLLAPGLAAKLRSKASELVASRYSWDAVADQTLGVYEEVMDEYFRTPWNGRPGSAVETEMFLARVSEFFSRLAQSRYSQTHEGGSGK